MKCRLANMEDLPRIKAVYEAIIERMNRENIQIWDDVYPCSFFSEDIKDNRFYVLEEGGEIAAAFALCGFHTGAEQMDWEEKHGKAWYIDRLGVNVNFLRKGIGRAALKHAADLARAKGADYLRLFVVDSNEPAIKLYQNSGFKMANGCYEERIDEDLTLKEFGFELKTTT